MYNPIYPRLRLYKADHERAEGDPHRLPRLESMDQHQALPQTVRTPTARELFGERTSKPSPVGENVSLRAP